MPEFEEKVEIPPQDLPRISHGLVFRYCMQLAQVNDKLSPLGERGCEGTFQRAWIWGRESVAIFQSIDQNGRYSETEEK